MKSIIDIDREGCAATFISHIQKTTSLMLVCFAMSAVKRLDYSTNMYFIVCIVFTQSVMFFF